MVRFGMHSWVFVLLLAGGTLLPTTAEAHWFKWLHCRHGHSSGGGRYALSNAPSYGTAAPAYDVQRSIFSAWLAGNGEQLLEEAANKILNRIGSGRDCSSNSNSATIDNSAQLDRIEAMVKSLKDGQVDIEGRLINNGVLDSRMGEKVYEASDKIDTIYKQTYLEDDGSVGALPRLISELKAELKGSAALQLETRITKLEQDLVNLKTELKTDMAGVNASVTSLKSDVDGRFNRLETLIRSIPGVPAPAGGTPTTP